MILGKNIMTFVIYITSFSISSMSIHLTQKAQIGLFITKEIIIAEEYSDFSNIFLKKKLWYYQS